MKAKLFLLLIAACSVTLVGCDKDDDDDNINVSKEYQTAFSTLYPDTKWVSWEREGAYYTAEFWRNDINAEAEAWFDGQAKWLLTITELSYNSLPEAVKTAHSTGDYNTWRVEDTDMVEKEGAPVFYVIEVEKSGKEYDLYYDANGVLEKAIPDNDNYPWGYIQ